MESPETNLHVYGQFIYFNGGAAERVERTLSINGARSTGYLCKKKKKET